MPHPCIDCCESICLTKLYEPFSFILLLTQGDFADRCPLSDLSIKIITEQNYVLFRYLTIHLLQAAIKVIFLLVSCLVWRCKHLDQGQVPWLSCQPYARMRFEIGLYTNRYADVRLSRIIPTPASFLVSLTEYIIRFPSLVIKWPFPAQRTSNSPRQLISYLPSAAWTIVTLPSIIMVLTFHVPKFLPSRNWRFFAPPEHLSRDLGGAGLRFITSPAASPVLPFPVVTPCWRLLGRAPVSLE